MKTNTEKKITRLFKQWAKWYRDEFEEFAAIAPEQVQDQIDFIENYLSAMLLGRPENEQVAWAEQFFEIQKICLDEDTLQLQFLGDLSYATLFVRDISEADLSTVYDLTEFESITIDRGDEKDWTKQDIKAILRDIRDDLELDFSKGSLKHSIEDNSLNVRCSISENASDGEPMNYDDPIRSLERIKKESLLHASKLFKKLSEGNYSVKVLVPEEPEGYECDYCLHTNRASYRMRDKDYDAALNDLDKACNETCRCGSEFDNMFSFFERAALFFRIGCKDKAVSDIRYIMEQSTISHSLSLVYGNMLSDLLYRFGEDHLSLSAMLSFVEVFYTALDHRRKDEFGMVMISPYKDGNLSFALNPLIEEQEECIARTRMIINRNQGHTDILKSADNLKAAIVKLRQKEGI